MGSAHMNCRFHQFKNFQKDIKGLDGNLTKLETPVEKTLKKKQARYHK